MSAKLADKMVDRWKTSPAQNVQQTPQEEHGEVDTELVQELEKLRDHVYRLVSSCWLCSICLTLLHLFKYFYLFYLFNAGSRSEGRTLVTLLPVVQKKRRLLEE